MLLPHYRWEFQFPFDTHDTGGNFDGKIGEEFDLSPIDFGFINEICAASEKRFPNDIDSNKKKDDRKKYITGA